MHNTIDARSFLTKSEYSPELEPFLNAAQTARRSLYRGGSIMGEEQTASSPAQTLTVYEFLQDTAFEGYPLPSRSEEYVSNLLVPSFEAPVMYGHSLADLLLARTGRKKLTNPICDLLNKVTELHRSGMYVAAADTLLGDLVRRLDEADFFSINSLLDMLAEDSQSKPTLYNDRGLARVINVLSLTLRHREKLPSRPRLRDAYRERILQLEGAEAARRSVAYL